MARLYVVATPIGNLGDMSPRMREVLENCDLIAAEDTRVTMKLLQVADIRKPMISCHRHNEDDRKGGIVERMLTEDLTVALTCDAGTPGISDPGEALVNECWEEGIPVTPVSGPSAVATALSVSGFDTREFAFYGFLPRESKALKEKLHTITQSRIQVSVLYESPHRVRELLETIAKELPGARVCVCCDLTKKFERIDRGAAGEIAVRLKEMPNAEKGEYCVVLDTSSVPIPEVTKTETEDVRTEIRLLEKMLGGQTLEQAVFQLKEEGIKRNELYRARLAVSDFLDSQQDKEE